MRSIVVTDPQHVPKQPIDGKPTLVYWNILGLAQASRLALAAAGVDFIDVRIEGGDPTKESYKQAWTKVKADMVDVLPFPNLPYYLDSDGVALVQSDAILRHIGRKYDLMGTPGQEHILDQALDELKDNLGGPTYPAYRDGADAVAAWYESSAAGILAKWKSFLGSKDFLTGKCLSVADCKLYVFLYTLTVIQEKLQTEKTILEDDWIIAFMRRVEEIPHIKEYMESREYMQRPLNSPQAKFNN